MRHTLVVTLRNMLEDPPDQIGRYLVGHTGGEWGVGIYYPDKGIYHPGKGWTSAPPWGPEFWADFHDQRLRSTGPRMDFRKVPTP